MMMLIRGVWILPVLIRLVMTARASAQPADPRVEVGGYVSTLRIGEFNGMNAVSVDA